MTVTARPHLFIATPMYGGMCAGEYARSLMRLCARLQEVAINYHLSFMYNESLITRGREFIIEQGNRQ